MEYSPNCAIPYVARVDAGTVELVRKAGVEVVSSGDLIQRFAAVWDERAMTTHRTASEKLLPDQGPRVRGNPPPSGRGHRGDGVRHPAGHGRMVRRRTARQRFAAECVGRPATPATRTTCRPPTTHRAIHPDELVLLDLWGKLETPGAVYADITWVGFTGRRAPADAAAGVRGGGGGARRGRQPRAARGRRRPGAARLAGRPARRPRCCRAPAMRIESCIEPATAWARTCTATASTWTITKRTMTGGC